MKYALLVLLFSQDVDALASTDYTAREAAEQRLSRWADLCWPLLVPAAEDRDPERLRRARRLLARVAPDSPPPLTLLVPTYGWYWFDSEGCECYDMRCRRGCVPLWGNANYREDLRSWLVRHYYERARTQFWENSLQLVPDARRATGLLVRDLLWLGVPAPVVRAVLLGPLERAEAKLMTVPAVGQ